MATMLSVTITSVGGALNAGSRRSERNEMAVMLERVAQEVMSATVNSNSTLVDRNGTAVGSWTYTPIASA